MSKVVILIKNFLGGQVFNQNAILLLNATKSRSVYRSLDVFEYFCKWPP